MNLFDRILDSRGITGDSVKAFLEPSYSSGNDPFLLPDIDKAVARLKIALNNNEKITIYGDYDIDGLTASAVLLDAFASFGFKNVEVFIPNRFVEGYGLSSAAIESIAKNHTKLIVTVDCGSLSKNEIERCNELGVDIIVTDHHGTLDVQPPAIAVINPKRKDSKYPFNDLASVGVAFKLVQAMQKSFDGLLPGQEKWLLDLVALGTVCDVVSLTNENRNYVYWGLEVMKKTRRQGLRALAKVAGIDINNVNSRTLGFGMGPRMNAAGRMETAKYALDMLVSSDINQALENAEILESLNVSRRQDQDKILKAAIIQAESRLQDSVLVLSDSSWSHGIIGIVASKIMEKYKKPTVILQEIGDLAKGSARSYGDYHIANSIKRCSEIITKGGGHKYAAGLTLPVANINELRNKLNQIYNEEYRSEDQQRYLIPAIDAVANLAELTNELMLDISKLEPFGNGNPEPILESQNLTVTKVKRMGNVGQHIKLDLTENNRDVLGFVSFNAPDSFFVEVGDLLNVRYQPIINEWQGRKSIEGRLIDLDIL